MGTSTTTDANGNYSFTSLAAGNYAVEFLAPNGDKFSPMGTGPDPTANSKVNVSGITGEVAVVGGSNTPNQNAGLYVPGSITTHVYSDANKDNAQDNGEGNLAGVTVNLLTQHGCCDRHDSRDRRERQRDLCRADPRDLPGVGQHADR